MKTSTELEKLLLSCSSSLISFARFLFDTTDYVRTKTHMAVRSVAATTTFNFDTPIDDHYPAIVGVTVRLEHAAS